MEARLNRSGQEYGIRPGCMNRLDEVMRGLRSECNTAGQDDATKYRPCVGLPAFVGCSGRRLLSDLNAQRPLPASVISPPQPNPKEDFMQPTLLL